MEGNVVLGKVMAFIVIVQGVLQVIGNLIPVQNVDINVISILDKEVRAFPIPQAKRHAQTFSIMFDKNLIKWQR